MLGAALFVVADASGFLAVDGLVADSGIEDDVDEIGQALHVESDPVAAVPGGRTDIQMYRNSAMRTGMRAKNRASGASLLIVSATSNIGPLPRRRRYDAHAHGNSTLP